MEKEKKKEQLHSNLCYFLKYVHNTDLSHLKSYEVQKDAHSTTWVGYTVTRASEI